MIRGYVDKYITVVLKDENVGLQNIMIIQWNANGKEHDQKERDLLYIF
jgi:hypothetical protein